MRTGMVIGCGLLLTACQTFSPDGGMGFGGLTTNAPPNSVSCAWNSHDAQPGLYPPSSAHPGGAAASATSDCTRASGWTPKYGGCRVATQT